VKGELFFTRSAGRSIFFTAPASASRLKKADLTKNSAALKDVSARLNATARDRLTLG
jgi:hypothetical protein